MIPVKTFAATTDTTTSDPQLPLKEACANEVSSVSSAGNNGLSTAKSAAQSSAVAVSDIGIANDIGQAAQAAQNQAYITGCENALFNSEAKQTINQMTDSIVSWADTGFDGGPIFIDNPETHFADIANDSASNTLSELFPSTGDSTSAGPVCNQFSSDLKVALASEYSDGGTPTSEVQCTLPSAVNDPNWFNEGWDAGGGLGSWYDETQNLQNNAFGAQLIAEQDINSQAAEEVNTQTQEADWGNGFQSVTNGQPGALNQITTPGSIIESALGITVTSPLRQLEVADQYNEVVSGLSEKLLTNTVSGSGGGLLGASQVQEGETSSLTQQLGNDQLSDDPNGAGYETSVSDFSLPSTPSNPSSGPNGGNNNGTNGNGGSTVISFPITVGGGNGNSSGTPETVDLALSGTASESAIVPGTTGVASLAIDGNTSMIDNQGFEQDARAVASSTNTYAWWQVDLGSIHSVSSIKVWPRFDSDFNPKQIGAMNIVVSDIPFPTGFDSLTVVPTSPDYYVIPISQTWLNANFQNAPFNFNITDSQGNPTTFKGRYVRIQVTSKTQWTGEQLNLAEVQVFGQ